MNADSIKLDIVQAGPHDADLISILIYELLKEISIENKTEIPVNDVELNNLCHQLFEQENTNFYAFLAFAHMPETGIRKPVGVMTLTEIVALYGKGRFGMIMEFFVDPNFRSRRAGVQLLETAKIFGHEKGWKSLEVAAPDIIGGKRAVGFYHREGFRKTGPTMNLELS